ncbi:NADH:flavin oxidoreductase/NADH oxidase [Castellaniella sp. GW247-6E4]|uniref:NADH:flavin oxidoreductase/NADH oxidase n=1 Tax=Castellaniella sp. GW247-6E4 TaxID=3140380 RepID=UPI003315AB80
MSILFSPLSIGPLRIQNRVVVLPMCQYVAQGDGLLRPWHIMHYGNLATSGAGLVIIEATGVQDTGRISPNDLGLYNSEQEARFTELLAGIRTFSPAKFGVQLSHAGRKASSQPFDNPNPVPVDAGGWLPSGPSPSTHNDRWPTPHELSRSDIESIVDSFVAAARRADRAGFDLIEIHGAHGYLVSSFLSPVANQRRDEYGGSLENRMRLATTIARAVRAVWPADKALGFRLNGTDWIEGGIVIDETVAVAKTLKGLGVDYISVSSGGNTRAQQLPPMVAGYQVSLAERVRKDAQITTLAAGLIVTPTQAEHIVASGQADLTGIGRAVLDDPRWGLHAQHALGDKTNYPRSHWRASPEAWPGFPMAHPLRA